MSIVRRRLVIGVLVLACLAPGMAQAEVATRFPQAAEQGAMVIGRVAPDASVRYAGRELRVTDYGTVVFGIARDARQPAEVTVTHPDGRVAHVRIAIRTHDWPVQRVNGVPQNTVTPPPAVAKRIAREQAAVAAVRRSSSDVLGFAQHFIRPAPGPVSGHFGAQRIYNGTPGSAHSGMDIAAGAGTPVVAPAAGRVVFAEPALYLTGGTVLIDHGHGIGSNFLHLSRIDVAVGKTIDQGQRLGAVGASGRATGAHLHWGMTWYDVRIDPEQVLAR